jgi:glucose-1-phosphate adenylyltransferase
LSDCDLICNIDLNEVLEDHKAKKADMTIVTRTLPANVMFASEELAKVSVDENGMATEIINYRGGPEEAEVSTNIMIFNRLFLLNIINDAIAHGYKKFYQDMIASRLSTARVNCYHYDGVCLQVNSLASYFACSMQLLNPEIRNALFNVENRAVYTKLRNSAPTVYAGDSKVVNSYVADGCVIEGTVENSIIFRGVRIGKGTVVKNSILLQDTFTGTNVSLNCVITDKNVAIRDNRVLSGHESMPIYVDKGRMI